MSLHKFADMVAKQGRGDDSLLIHMTPDEVQRLQKFAEANGRSLTINPTTGLPEAGMLSDLFKAVAPIALGAFLGPGAFGITGLGLSATTAGLVTGGLTTLATGSLSRGLMAGLGAYGGAGLAQGIADAGAGAGLSEALAGSSGGTGAQVFGDVAAAEGSSGQAFNEFLKSNANPATMTGADKFSAGLGAIKDAPMDFAKQNLGNIAAAASPIMAGAMVPTTTKLPENTSPAYIRQKLYDPYTQTYKSLTPVKASEWGGRSFSDAYTNPQTGQMATLQPRAPGMAGGGIVALAAGGAPTMLSDEQLYQKTGSWEAAAAARDDQNRALNIYNDAQRLASAVGSTPANAQLATAAPAAQTAPVTTAAPTNSAGLQWWENQGKTANDYYDYINNALATNKNATDAQIDAAVAQGGISGADIAEALRRSGGSQAELYSIGAGNMGLAGLNTNINNWLATANADPNFAKLTAEQKQQAARDAMGTVDMNEADVVRATGKTIAQLFPKSLVPPTTVIPGGYYGNNTGNPLTTTPGDITTNPDGTVTVTPNIPGRPDGGFTGMGQVKDAYTAGGGSLGYTAKAPRTIAEFNQMYNRQTGDSLAAYDYLMGKGAYPTRSKAADTTTGIMQPYFSGAMRYKPRYLSYDKEGNIVSSSTSGKPADTTKTGDLTKAKTIEVVDSSGYDNQTYTAVLQDDGTYLAGNGKRYDVTGKELAADGGMMGYAMGGGLGSLGSYSDGGRLLRGPGDGVSDSIPATIGKNEQPARLADGEFVVPARIVSELGNGSTEAGARKLYAMMDRVQKARGKTTGKDKVAANTRSDKYLPA